MLCYDTFANNNRSTKLTKKDKIKGAIDSQTAAN